MPADANAILHGTHDFAVKVTSPLWDIRFQTRSLVYAKRMTVGIRDVAETVYIND